MPHALQHVYEMSDLAERWNALPESRRWAAEHGRPKYDHRKVKRILDAFGVECFQERRGEPGKKGTKFYVTHGTLVRSKMGGELLNSLLDVEALAGPDDTGTGD